MAARADERGRARDAGWTPAGNTFGSAPRRAGAAVLTGSHIDTVPEGGPLDGALGVLAGLECLQAIRRAGLDTPAAAGGGGLERRGRPLRQPLRLAGLHRQARPGRDPRAPRRWTATGSWTRWRAPASTRSGAEGALRSADALRLRRAAHRAGPAPRGRAHPIGVVEGIVGIRRNRLTFVGEPDHAGTTPMAWRKDAFLAAAEYALKAREHIVRKGSGRSVTNFGRIELAPGRLQHRARAGRAAAGDARAGPEDPGAARPRVRGPRPRHRAPARPEGGRRGHVAHRARALRARGSWTRCRRPARQLKLRYKRMPSGAGHDAQNLATRDRLRDALHPLAGRAQPPARRDERLEGHRARAPTRCSTRC